MWDYFNAKTKHSLYFLQKIRRNRPEKPGFGLGRPVSGYVLLTWDLAWDSPCASEVGEGFVAVEKQRGRGFCSEDEPVPVAI
jgi:hypothetical protein